ncbi:LVIVD repeat-containing protein [Halobellus rufus]|uniref:LVIVD repeat-containing protein n=1 Tax=Halobellus rufus TaxID=1448860 RepID=UPI000AD6C8FB|nr:hypothetical protein [Halobellus rufus]
MKSIEQHNVSFVGYHNLQGRPGFKIALQEVNDRWLLYVAGMWHSGLSILDVTDPSNPKFIRWVDGPPNTETIQVQVADGLMITSLEKPYERRNPVDGPQADPDAAYKEGAYIWDVESDPTDPQLLSHWKTGGDGTHRNFYDGGKYAYMSAQLEGYEGNSVVVLDVSNPENPEEVSRWCWEGQEPNQSATERTYFHGPAYRDGDVAYLSYGSVGMVTLDLSNVSEPTLLNRVDFGDLGSWIGTHSAIPIPDTDLVAVNSEAIVEKSPLNDGGEPLNYVFLVDASDLDKVGYDGLAHKGPRIVSSMPTPTPEDDLEYDTYHQRPGRFGPHNQHHYRENGPRYRTSDYLIMTFFNAGLRIFDISEPLAPTEVGSFVADNPDGRIGKIRPEQELVSTFEDVVVDDRGYIYCTDPQQGLFILSSELLPSQR